MDQECELVPKAFLCYNGWQLDSLLYPQIKEQLRKWIRKLISARGFLARIYCNRWNLDSLLYSSNQRAINRVDYERDSVLQFFRRFLTMDVIWLPFHIPQIKNQQREWIQEMNKLQRKPKPFVHMEKLWFPCSRPSRLSANIYFCAINNPEWISKSPKFIDFLECVAVSQDSNMFYLDCIQKKLPELPDKTEITSKIRTKYCPYYIFGIVLYGVIQLSTMHLMIF